jgi:hypothetical protein
LPQLLDDPVLLRELLAKWNARLAGLQEAAEVEAKVRDRSSSACNQDQKVVLTLRPSNVDSSGPLVKFLTRCMIDLVLARCPHAVLRRRSTQTVSCRLDVPVPPAAAA